MSKLSESEVRAIIDARAGKAVSMTELQKEREQALDCYYGRPMGNEIEGRAQVVSRILMNVIEWTMPSLLRIFATQQAVQFDPVGPEDTEQAKEETGYVRHVFWKLNPGFMITYEWLKDGLQQKNGYVKYWWQDEQKVRYDEFTGLTEEQLLLVFNEYEQRGEVEIIGAESDEHGMYSIRLKVKEAYGCAKVECVTPDEVLVDRGCRGRIKTARFVGHLRTDVTRGELIEQGYDRARVEALTSYTPSKTSTVEIARNTVEQLSPDQTASDDDGDWASEELTLLECYTYLDEDDDGIPELRRMLLGGNDILEDEEAPEIQWEDWTPIPVPHRHNGQGYFDIIEDDWRIDTALKRSMLDNAYFGNNQRLIYDKNTIDVASLQINRPGGHVANDGPVAGAFALIPNRDIASYLLPIIEHFQQDVENRTGVGRGSMGLDADVLAQSTKGAYMDAKASANQRIEAIARIFAETALASLYGSLHRLLMRHQDWPERYRLQDKWVTVNPTEWQERANLTVSVGLGNASKEEIRANLGLMAQAQEKAAQVPGLIQPQNVFALLRRLQTELGFENESFATDPSSPEYQNFLAQQGKSEDPYITGEKIKAQTRLQEQTIESRDKALDRAQERDLTITDLEVTSKVDLATAGIGAEVALRRGAGAPGPGSGTGAREPAGA